MEIWLEKQVKKIFLLKSQQNVTSVSGIIILSFLIDQKQLSPVAIHSIYYSIKINLA